MRDLSIKRSEDDLGCGVGLAADVDAAGFGSDNMSAVKVIVDRRSDIIGDNILYAGCLGDTGFDIVDETI